MVLCLYSTYITTFFCEVGVQPFYAALAVGANIFVSSFVQSTLTDKVCKVIARYNVMITAQLYSLGEELSSSLSQY